MTEDLNQPNESKKTELCDSCAAIQRNWRRAPGHAELVQGDNRQEKRGGHMVTITSGTMRTTRPSSARVGRWWGDRRRQAVDNPLHESTSQTPVPH